MSSDESPPSPAPQDRREAVREKAQQVQAKQSRARALRRVAMGVGVVAVVAVAATVVTWAFTSSSKPQLSPANISNDGFTVTSVAGVAVDTANGSAPDAGATASPTPSPAVPTAAATPAATKSAPVDIRVYVDYLSSGSRDFQMANVQQLSKWVSQDAATLTYYPVSMLASKSNGTKYSLRAASAAACVATHAPDTFFAFNDALLRKQPPVDSDGLSDADLATLAIASGASDPKAVRSCIETESFASWAAGATDRALQGLPDTDSVSLTATPTVLVNGMPYVGKLDDPKEFAQFVLTIASDAYYKTASPTPTASPSPSTTMTTTPLPSSTR
ncbi:DsbA family protein [Microbacterium rhizomatis]|uniref:Thioredoxin domain-containing protein n=1 Tax=Microbacterium rhizomatis TaxID=1631477 RepID=A0A5J5J2X2_9MICO|nr:thioredoxin domain-containing protein [Microbacterium rhizomatis]KAA9107528.1 thioredoxin domain-containing protein [Microbacterium rhizomatis]